MNALRAAPALVRHRMVRGAVALAAARVVTLVCALAVVSMLVRALSPADFGFWSALASFTTLSLGLDLGIGNAARNRMATLRAGGDEEGAATALVSTLLVLAALSAALVVVVEVGLVVTASLGLTVWGPDHLPAAMVAIACLGVYQTANLGAMALYAREQSATVAAVEVTRCALMLVAVGAAWLAHASLFGATVAYFGALAGGALLSLVVVWASPRWRRRPPTLSRAWATVRTEVRAAGGFASLQVAAALFYQTDVLLATQLAPLEAVGEYAIVLRLFSVPLSLQMAAVVPLWSGAAIELARGRREWVMRTADRAGMLSLAALGTASAGGVLLGPTVLRVWAGRPIEDLTLYLGIGVWVVVAGWVAVYSVVLNGIGRVRMQALLLGLALVLKVVIAFAFVGRVGLAALAWGAALALLPLAWSNRRELVRALAEGLARERDASVKAVILAGGRGTRLQEETDVIPKPMLRVGGLPLIEHIMGIYAAHGVTEFVVALGYRGDIIKSYFAEHALMRRDFTVDLGTGQTETHARDRDARDDWRIHLVDTGMETMTGGRLGRLRDWIGGETFCMTYGDGLANVDLSVAIALCRRC